MHFSVANSLNPLVNTRTVKFISYEYFRIWEKVMGEKCLCLKLFLPEKCSSLSR